MPMAIETGPCKVNDSSRTSARHRLRLFGLCPLLALDLSLVEAALLAMALSIVLFGTQSCMALLQHWLIPRQRLLATGLVAATLTAVIDLLLQVMCYRQAQQLHIYLPLLVIVPLLFYKIEDIGKPQLSRVAIDASISAGAFATALITLALLRAPPLLDAGIPLGLIGGGLLLALANKFIVDDNTPTTRIPRARVTGPVR
jgi:Na+-translocating ferredoxin:NAD+ oxidoreductase RnfE subunit